jgi:hypothetical protein
MPSTLLFATAIALSGVASAAPQFLAPENTINLPASESASEPLKWLGANSPWFAGMAGLIRDIFYHGVANGCAHSRRP